MDAERGRPFGGYLDQINLALYHMGAEPRAMDVADCRHPHEIEHDLKGTPTAEPKVDLAIAPAGRDDENRLIVAVSTSSLFYDTGACARQIEGRTAAAAAGPPPPPAARDARPQHYDDELVRPLIGVRAMGYHVPTGLLASLNHHGSGSWDGAAMEMLCAAEGHTEPQLDGCGCGLYAYYSYEHLLADDEDVALSTDYVRCVVKAYGAIAEAEYGFASQYMKPLAVLYDHPHPAYFGVEFAVLSAFEALAARLSVPLIEPEDIPDFAAGAGIYRPGGG